MITMKELQDKIGGVFYFATVEDGEPRVRPFGFTMVFENKLYFGCEVQKAMYESAPFLEKTYNAATGHHHICFYLEDLSAMEFKGPEAIRLV